MLTEKERGVVAGFREWATALRNDDTDTQRKLEQSWCQEPGALVWHTKAQRNEIIRRLHNSGMKPGMIAYKMGINRVQVWRILRGDR